MIIENDIEEYLVREVRKLGGLCWKFESPGTAGVPDRIVIYNRIVVFVEVKKPNETLRKLQIKRIKEIHGQNVRAGWLSDKYSVDCFIATLIEESEREKGWYK